MILPGLLFVFIPCLSCGNLVLCHSLLLIWGIWRSVGSVGQPFLNLHRHDSWISQLSWLTQTQFKYYRTSQSPASIQGMSEVGSKPHRFADVRTEVVEGEWTPCCWWSHRLPYAAPNPHWKKTWRLAHHLTPSNSMILHDFHSLLSSNIVQGILCSQCPCKNPVLCSCERANFSSACHSQKKLGIIQIKPTGPRST